MFKAGQSSGSSGCFFFFTKNKRFLIKTLRGSELEILKNMLDDYINHISVKTKNNSLLARIYGIFTIKNTGLRPINLIIM